VLAGFWYDRYPEARQLLERLPPGVAAVRTGHVSEPDVAGLYSLAAAVALVSLSEGFGFPVLEAMCYGAPAVVSRGTALEEIAGPAAELVDPLSVPSIAEGLKHVLADSQRAQELRRAGEERVRAFPWRDTAAATLEAYQDAAAGGRRGS
jgi:alpha-1,3-rhamnosyl/mannosyltransferase